MKAPRGQREIKRPPALATSFTWKSGVLDMDSSNSFTLGFPLFLFLPPAAAKKQQPGIPPEMLSLHT